VSIYQLISVSPRVFPGLRQSVVVCPFYSTSMSKISLATGEGTCGYTSNWESIKAIVRWNVPGGFEYQ